MFISLSQIFLQSIKFSSIGMSEEEQKRFASVVADCVKTSTELLNLAKEFCTELQKEKERDVRQYLQALIIYFLD